MNSMHLPFALSLSKGVRKVFQQPVKRRGRDIIGRKVVQSDTRSKSYEEEKNNIEFGRDRTRKEKRERERAEICEEAGSCEDCLG